MTRRTVRALMLALRAFAAVLGMAEVPGALLGLANACYWLGDLPGMMQSLERAYTAARRRPDPVLAAAAVLSLVGYHKQFMGNVATARAGWRGRRGSWKARRRSYVGELLGGTADVTDVIHYLAR
jgi:hypothetical protein